MSRVILPLAILLLTASLPAAEPRSVSGIYPHLAMFNDEAECGTGAVVPWAGRLWAITYAPHKPEGSSDKLYEITPELAQIVRPESIGGTPANRMIHRESNQLFIGPYVIDEGRRVRVIPARSMYGRLTGNARHLADPAGKIYYATMEEGLYEVDVRTLAVTELWTDEQRREGRKANLPGYHGKGLYSGQGRLVYANNGEHGAEAQKRPDVPSGVLAEWDGRADAWTVVRRNQFTEVTGPGGIFGNERPDSDPLWSIGWDHRSLILACCEEGRWHTWRLPKGSHSYDGAHGWNTEWPRIRDIGEPSLLMTMHGTFWRFPKTFSAKLSAGIAPHSNYLKVVGDFCEWNGRLVFGCDDTAKSEFLNKRRAKGEIAGPGQSQSNLWFVEPEKLSFGRAIGRGAVWLDEPVKAGAASDAYLFSGYAQRGLHLAHGGNEPARFALEVDREGTGKWTPLKTVEVPPQGYVWTGFSPDQAGAWIRIVADRDLPQATAFFDYQADPPQSELPEKKTGKDIFAGLTGPDDAQLTGGLLHARGGNFRTLRFVASDERGEVGCYDLDAELNLKRVEDDKGMAWTRQAVAIPKDVLSLDGSSLLYLDDTGRRWRLPVSEPALTRPGPLGIERVAREVCTERDLFNAGGTFFELPAENAGGFAKIRPIASHNRRIKDYCSYRGLLVLTGIATGAEAGEHIIRSDDGRCALWVGAVDDLWKFGPPRGRGGPWLDSGVKARAPSDPFLMTGYDRKRLELSHAENDVLRVRIEVDVSGTGQWLTYRDLAVAPGQTPTTHEFPQAFSAYWVRLVPDRDAQATATFIYDLP